MLGARRVVDTQAAGQGTQMRTRLIAGGLVASGVLLGGYWLTKGDAPEPSGDSSYAAALQTPATQEPVADASSTQAVPTSGTAPTGPPDDADACAGGSGDLRAAVGPETSCEFALNVLSAYTDNGGNGSTLQMQVHSPVTDLDYDMTCENAAPVVCTAPTGAVVYLYTADPAEAESDGTASPQTALESLQAAYADGASRFTANGQWVIQLASKWNGITDTYATTAAGSHRFRLPDILSEYTGLKDTFGSDVVLVQSTDFGKQQSYAKKPADEPMWVTIYDPGTFATKGEAAAWCSDAFAALSGRQLRNACYPRQAVPSHG